MKTLVKKTKAVRTEPEMPAEAAKPKRPAVETYVTLAGSILDRMRTDQSKVREALQSIALATPEALTRLRATMVDFRRLNDLAIGELERVTAEMTKAASK